MTCLSQFSRESELCPAAVSSTDACSTYNATWYATRSCQEIRKLILFAEHIIDGIIFPTLRDKMIMLRGEFGLRISDAGEAELPTDRQIQHL